MIIQRERSIIPACDIQLKDSIEIFRQTGDLEKIGGFKFGVAFLDNLGLAVEVARRYTKKPIIYDHQKAGTDIPDRTPDQFMDSMLRAGVDAIILFPQAGPITEYEWIMAAQDRDLGVIVGGEMTHPRYLYGDTKEGKEKNYTQIFEDLGISRPLSGFIREDAPEDIYELAARMGVTDFVMPGNKPDRIKHYKTLIESCGVSDPAIYSPGLITQGGDIGEGAKAAGRRFHGIVGSGVYKAKDMRQAAIELSSKI